MRDYQFWVYIMASKSGTLYIGMTNDLAVRVAQHKSGEFEGFASKYGCTRLVYFEKYQDVHRAIGREKQLKGWRREKKIKLIESQNPRWADLAEHWGKQMAFANQSTSVKVRMPLCSTGAVHVGGVLRLGLACDRQERRVALCSASLRMTPPK